MTIEKIDMLDGCTTEQDIDDALIQLGFVSVKDKCEKLIDYMGALVHTMEEEEDEDYNMLYAVTKEAFLIGNWRDLRG